MAPDTPPRSPQMPASSVPAHGPGHDPMQTEQNVYANVYYALIVGMLISTALFIWGLIQALRHRTNIPLTRKWIQQQYHWSIFWQGLRHAQPTPILMLATLILVLTPVLRVVSSIYAFWVDKDYKYTVVTGIVFGVIVLTVILSRLGLR